MNFSPRIHNAIKYAACWHDGQVRKSDGETPYVSHLFSVALILSGYTDDEDIIIAALFHDVLEDISLEYAEEIEERYGARVLQLVREVSEDKDPNAKEEKPWRERKEGYLEGLRKHSTDALLVSAADKMHNLISLRVSVADYGREVLEAFSSSADERMWFYSEVLSILQERLDDPIVRRLSDELERTKDVVLERNVN